MSNGYNGWSNYETWLVNLWFGDTFSLLADEGSYIDGEYLKTYIDEYLEQNMEQSGLIADIVNQFVHEVDWDEIAEHYIEELEDA